MTLSDFDLEAEIVGKLDLLEIETSGGTLRFLAGDDGWFKDVNGNIWTGSKLMSISSIDHSVGGTAPDVTATFSYVQDPDAEDMFALIREHGGADAVKGRKARLWYQHIGQHGEFYAPVAAPVLIFERVCQNLTFSFDGPQQRTVALSIEGPFNLRSRPVGGTYSTHDHARRLGVAANPSLEFMPGTTMDEQPLFGL
jgi:hypothetical protein